MTDQEEEKEKPGIHPFVSTTKSTPINKNIKTETASENSSEVFLVGKPINLSKSQYSSLVCDLLYLTRDPPLLPMASLQFAG